MPYESATEPFGVYHETKHNTVGDKVDEVGDVVAELFHNSDLLSARAKTGRVGRSEGKGKYGLISFVSIICKELFFCQKFHYHFHLQDMLPGPLVD